MRSMQARFRGPLPATTGGKQSPLPRAVAAADNLGLSTDEDGGQPDYSLWWIHGRAYNLTAFMDQHPGR